MIDEGQDTSANKTHLFNWLYDVTVQMAQGAGVCLLNVYGMSTVFPFVHACIHMCVLWMGGGGSLRLALPHPFCVDTSQR